jgi:tryptophan synthase alpha chain
MSAIAQAFTRILPPHPAERDKSGLAGGSGRQQGVGGFIPYITAGDPDLATTYEILLALGRAGATVIELGFPFSDPMADGPVIQRACMRALKNRITIDDVLAVTREAKSKIGSPVVLFSYVNPVLQYGFERLIASAGENGISGLLLTDLPADNGARLAAFARRYEVDLITLAAPTCTDERLKTICAHASGFIYAVSRTGVTGTRRELGADARTLVERIRRCTPLPVALGFGVSNREQAREVLTFADAVVVGSAIVHEIEKNLGGNDLVAKVERLAREFAETGGDIALDAAAKPAISPLSTPASANAALAGDPWAVKETH